MNRIYSYVLRYDDGAAPNPFWGFCTLTICKPAIRRGAEKGDWVIGTGSKNSRLRDGKIYDLSNNIVYAMRVTDKLTLAAYDQKCRHELQNKIPDWISDEFKVRMGDCIYDDSTGTNPVMRKSVHNESNRKRDLGGKYSLLSDTFYYLGEDSRPLPIEFWQIIKRNQGHRKIENAKLINEFKDWISQFSVGVFADPQLKFEFENVSTDEVIQRCSKNHYDGDDDETEESIC